eukprot:TRINITY_DN2745_c0_g1_i1.p1 TRINITY_DN2745_c0_g1~~TRINITY_DN2745_c0_g1_i1.p1  ORF type:complete len:283 (-),score=87.03 TRINITY_DN2745_c0_g1_i1:217-1065(-)
MPGEGKKWGDQSVDGLNKRWGDTEADYDKALDIDVDEEDENLKIAVSVGTNSKGQPVKITKKLRTVPKKFKVNKKVLDRKNIRKFGECAGLPAGLEPGVSAIGDELQLEILVPYEKVKNYVDKVFPDTLCRACGAVGDHWTDKCPFTEKVEKTAPPSRAEREAMRQQEKEDKDRYVIPSQRRGGGAGDTETVGRNRRDDAATIRVTNLSEDTKESDLQELFRTAGPISRIFLAKDRGTGLSKGYAFVTFVHREDAQKAMEKLSGFGYDHLILHIEWAKPSNP